MVIGESTIYAGREIAQVVGRDRRARREPGFVRGRPGSPSLPFRIDLIAHQIFPRLPISNQRKLVVTNQHFRGKGARIVI